MNDEELLSRLGRALVPPAGEPDPTKVARLRALAEAGRTPAADPLADRRESRAGGRQRRRFAGFAAGVAAAAASFLVGVLAGADPPRPLRAAAHAVGLPVESPHLTDARNELRALGEALAAGDRSRVAADDRRMVSLVKALPPDERKKIEPVAHEVHLRAVAFLKQQPG